MLLSKDVERLINDGCTVNEMCLNLGLRLQSFYDIVKDLRNDNKYYYPKVLENGETILTSVKENDDKPINLKFKDGFFSFIVISDVHDGNKYDNINRLQSIKDYMKVNYINLLINLGDLIDGPSHINQSMDRRVDTLKEQIDEIIKVYPYVNGLNICVLGDHDLKYKDKDGTNLNKSLKKERPDIRVFSSGSTTLKINDKEFILCHNVEDKWCRIDPKDNQMLISSHSHIYKNYTIYGSFGPALRIVCPALCDLPMLNGNMPGFLKFDLDISNGYITNIDASNYAFIEDRIYLVGTTSYKLNSNKEEYVRARKNK